MSLIREANQSDAKNLAELAESTFRDAFSAQNPGEDMDMHCRSSFGEAIQAEEIASSEWVTLVADDDGNLIAYAQLRFRQPPACVTAESPGEIHRIYVDTARHGKGIAHELMAACLDKMQVLGKDVVWLGVWEHNPRAIAFYKKYDFEEVGDHEFMFGSESQRDVIMVHGV